MEFHESSIVAVNCTIVEETQIFTQVLFHFFLQNSFLMVLVFEECLLGIGILSAIIYLVVTKQSNNPLTKEPKLKSAIRIVPQ